MLRKHTSFIDPSVGLVRKGLVAYENACKLRDRFVQLVQDISMLPWMFEQEEDLPQALKERLEACFDGVGDGECDEDLVRDFKDASLKVYRLETILRYPWDEDESGDNRSREMSLDVVFYEKGAKTPFYKIVQFFGIHTGDAYDIYWGEWPPAKKTDDSEKMK